MYLYKAALSKGKKLDVLSLAKLLSQGMSECKNDFERKEFGIAAITLCNYKKEVPYFYHGDELGHYYRNLIYIDEQISLKNLVWNPFAISSIHGHNSRGCWVLVMKGELIEKGIDHLILTCDSLTYFFKYSLCQKGRKT